MTRSLSGAAWYTGDPLDLLLVADDLLDALAASRPAWHRDGACRGMGTEMFFPDRGQSLEPARQVCSGCSVRAECEAAGGAGRDTVGIWGGTSAEQRRQARRRAA